MSRPFVHLSVHSEYSLADSVIRIPQLVAAVRDAGMPAVALTDESNLFALVKFYRAALAAGVKPLIGADVWVQGETPGRAHRLRLLCRNREGYRQLSVLLTRAYREGQQGGRPQLRFEWLQEASDGLIALSGGVQGELGHALVTQNEALAEAVVARHLAVFKDRFYLEVQRIGREHEEDYIAALCPLAARHGVPLVATNDVRFLSPDDFEAHEIRVCIHEGRTLDDPRRPREYTPQQHLRSSEEMAELFADLPEALDNTLELAKRCNFRLEFEGAHLPAFPVPAGKTLDDFFAEQAREGLERRLAKLQADGPWPAERLARYRQRLEHEIGVIREMGFAGYFLIVADFIRWARENGVPVGPGRGSGAGSLVAYALTITDLDPIQYDLLFERFLNPERVSLPDFDIDFCMEGRDRVIEYVAERYGRERVSQIITHGTMAARAVVRDVGRVLGHAYGFVDNIAKLVPFELGMTLEKALETSEELRRACEQDEEVAALIERARALEGLARNVGKHAGGVVIAPAPLTEFTPLYCEPDGEGVVTQLDKDDIEAIGLVKFDFLGLRTLTIIDRAVRTVNARRARLGEPPLDIARIPLDDARAFELLKAQATTAVFQLESHGMRELIKRLQPDCFEDIVALVALFRPGPLQSGMVDDFIARKHGQAPIHYPHPALEPILKPTYGVILYQEQVMQIAQVLAGYSLGGADLLRRAMGKKKPEEMARQRAVFLKGAVENGVDEATATHIFDLMEKFAGYGFNKSHSAAYALLAYQTAWLKAHHPAEFMAAVLSADMDHTDKIVRLIDECRNLGLEVLPPDVNLSDHPFVVDDAGRIVYGLGAIKGVGASAVEVLLAERERGGPFRDLYDLCLRCDPHKLNRRALEALIRAGACDSLGANRASLVANLPQVLKSAEQERANRASGQADIFGAAGAAPVAVQWTEHPEWSEEHRLLAEKETLGLYLTGHPVDRYRAELQAICGRSIAAHLAALEGTESRRNDDTVRLGGLLMSLRSKRTRSGKLAFAELDDGSGRVEMLIRPEDYENFAPLLELDRILVVEGQLAPDDFSGGWRLRARKIYDMETARAAFGRGLELELSSEQGANGLLEHLSDCLGTHRPGSLPVWVRFRSPAAEARLRLGEAWKVQPRDALIERLRKLLGEAAVRVVY